MSIELDIVVGPSLHLDVNVVATTSGGGGAVDSVDGQTGTVVLSSVYQPLDSDLTAIAALSTTSFGRALLTLADGAAARTTLGLGTAATTDASAYDAAGAAAAAQAASQPLDSDLTSIAALSTTSFGRGLLALADAAALRTSAGLGTAATSATTDFQVRLQVSAQYITTAASATSSTMSANRCYYLPIQVVRTATFDRIGVEHTATTAANAVARLGIYNSTNDLPSSLVLDAGTVDLSTAAALKTITISQSLTPGIYWLACVVNSATPVLRTGAPTIVVPSSDTTNNGTKFENGVTGNLPSTATPGTANASPPPIIWLRPS